MSNQKTYETEWLPNDWIDEVIPAGLRHSTDFIHRRDDGTYVITPKIGKDDLQPEYDDEGWGNYTKPVKAGDTVWFSPSELYGTFLLHVSGDGTFRIDGDYPGKANCFYLDEHEALGDSAEGLVGRGGEDGDSPLQPGEYSIQIYWWGSKIAFRFDIGPDGQPAFTEIGKVQ